MAEPLVQDVREARLRLALVPGLGPILTQRLQSKFGTAIAVCGATATQIAEVEGIGRKKADLIRRAIDEADVTREIDLIDQHGVTLLAIEDANYPALLRQIYDPPSLLYVRGSIEKCDSLGLAIVGSRACTLYGREQADRLAGLCSQAGLTIISGGARGIDSAAHRATLRVKGRTIAVVGCGLAECYPPENRELFDAIAAGGAMVSELPMTAPPLAENFPARNRIISGLSLGVLVVEASLRSGALITARLAAEEHHREVMALPGRVDSPASAGCHKILREGWATLVTNPADILDCLGEAGQTLKGAVESAAKSATDSPPSQQQATLPFTSPNLTGPAKIILDAITLDPISLDTLCETTGLPIHTLGAHLTQLQISGLVDRLPANHVKRRR